MILSYFSKKWKEAQFWIKTATFQAIEFTKNHPEKPVCKILCVDDDRSFCRFVKHLARSLGVQLDAVYSVHEAKQMIEDNPNYQAFIIDGHLPDGSGFEIVAWIREMKKLATPIGFISRVYQDSKSFRILKESFEVEYVLEKPIRSSEVHQLLKQLCYPILQSSSHEVFPDDLMLELQADYNKTISDKIERLEKMILAIQKAPTVDHLENLRWEVHKIAGSAGSYGYEGASELSKNLELDLIKQIELARQGQLRHDWLFVLDDFFSQIKLHFQIDLPESEIEKSLKIQHLPSVYIVDEDQAFLNMFASAYPETRFDILTESRPEKSVQTLLSGDFFPQILLFNAHFRSTVITGYELIHTFYLKNSYLTTIIALMVEQYALENQIEALQRGVTTILTKPFPIPLLLPLIDLIPFRPLPFPYKILVIDNDPDVSQYILKTLKFADLEITALQNLHDLQEILNSDEPDLILIDINLTDESGVRVIEQLRDEFKYRKMIVGMLTFSEQETYLIKKCYDAHVVEIIFKPIESGILQRKIAHILQRQAEKEFAIVQDSATGLTNIESFKRYLNGLQEQLKATSFPKTIVFFELEPFASVSQKTKKEILKEIPQALERLLKKYDMAAYLGKGLFALVFQGYDPYFVQLFMQTFLLQLHTHLKNVFTKNTSFHLNESLVILSKVETVDDMLKRGKDLMHLAQQQQPNQFVRLMTEPISINQKEVMILHDEIQPVDFLKTLFEKHSFNIRLLSKIDEEELPQLFSRSPLLILTGTFAEAKGVRLLKKLFTKNKIHIPILYLSHWPEEEYLFHLLNQVNYFQFPFSLVIIVPTK